MTMRTKDDVLLIGVGKCAEPECISSWAKICPRCNLSFCGVHVGFHICGAFRRPVFPSGQGAPGAVRRSDVVSGGPEERENMQRPKKGRSNAVKSVHRNGNGKKGKK